MTIWLNFFNAFLDGGQKKSSPKPNLSKYRTRYMQLNANEDIKDLCLIILFLANLIILHNYNQDILITARWGEFLCQNSPGGFWYL